MLKGVGASSHWIVCGISSLCTTINIYKNLYIYKHVEFTDEDQDDKRIVYASCIILLRKGVNEQPSTGVCIEGDALLRSLCFALYFLIPPSFAIYILKKSIQPSRINSSRLTPLPRFYCSLMLANESFQDSTSSSLIFFLSFH